MKDLYLSASAYIAAGVTVRNACIQAFQALTPACIQAFRAVIPAMYADVERSLHEKSSTVLGD